MHGIAPELIGANPGASASVNVLHRLEQNCIGRDVDDTRAANVVADLHDAAIDDGELAIGARIVPSDAERQRRGAD
jgi:hypothetical protein